jgi:hypothetical protein
MLHHNWARSNWMDMRDAEDGKLLWQSGEWGRRMLHEEMEARVPQVNGLGQTALSTCLETALFA